MVSLPGLTRDDILDRVLCIVVNEPRRLLPAIEKAEGASDQLNEPRRLLRSCHSRLSHCAPEPGDEGPPRVWPRAGRIPRTHRHVRPRQNFALAEFSPQRCF
jgi:hypothetical protein